MNELITMSNGKGKITSLELVKQINLFRAKIEGKAELRHDTLLNIIRDEFEQEIGLQKILESSYINSQNKQQPMFELTLSQAKQVLVRESKLVRKAVIAYIEALEAKLKSNLPTTYIEALEALLISEKEKERLTQRNEELEHKADYFDQLVDSNLLTNFRDTAKEFHIGQKEFVDWLLRNKYIYRDTSGKIKPYMQYVRPQGGLFEIKEKVKGEWAGTQTLITPRGRETFRLLLNGGNKLWITIC